MLQLRIAGGQLSSFLRMRYPDVIAGSISSSPTSFGCPGLGLVAHLPLFCITLLALFCRSMPCSTKACTVPILCLSSVVHCHHQLCNTVQSLFLVCAWQLTSSSASAASLCALLPATPTLLLAMRHYCLLPLHCCIQPAVCPCCKQSTSYAAVSIYCMQLEHGTSMQSRNVTCVHSRTPVMTPMALPR